jgi:hypothetical protein
MALATMRPPVSLSSAGHCRMELWLAAHGRDKEPIAPRGKRTLDVGTLAEAAMFDGLPGPYPDEPIGPWWPDMDEITDYSRRVTIKIADTKIIDRQREVKIGPFVGHIDGVMQWQDRNYVIDMKTTQGFGFKRHLTGDLMKDTFAREYCMQLQAYMGAVLNEGGNLAGGLLLFYNKENGKVMFRFVDKDPVLYAECVERLTQSGSPAEPFPDYEWTPGKKLPSRCSYCSFKTSCATQRGASLKTWVQKDGNQVWSVNLEGVV